MRNSWIFGSDKYKNIAIERKKVKSTPALVEEEYVPTFSYEKTFLTGKSGNIIKLGKKEDIQIKSELSNIMS